MLKSIARLLFDTASPLRAVRGQVRHRLGMKPLAPGFQWTRKVMYDRILERLNEIGMESMSALEIAPGTFWQQQGFASYKSVSFPGFDICSAALDERFDLIIADQVFEHLLWPYRAAHNALKMLNEDGILLVTTPFLIRRHENPVDCSRWTELGMKHLLAEAGFDLEDIETGSWGNKACVKANLKHFGWAALRRSSSLKNDPAFPCVVWAIARNRRGWAEEGPH